MRITSLLATESGQTNELPADPVVIGVVVLGLLLAMLVGLLMFGKGRPHS